MEKTEERQVILEEARKRYQLAKDADREDRNEAFEDKRFANGDQWPEDIADARKKAKRPCLTINQMPKFIDQVEGDFRQNKMSIKVRPQDSVSDPDTADFIEGHIRNIEINSDSGIVYGTALADIATCGRGAWRVKTKFVDDDSFDQDIVLEPIENVLSVYFDPDSADYNHADGKFVFVIVDVHEDEFKKAYPNASMSAFDTESFAVSEWYSGNKVTVAEYWRVVEDGEYTLYQLESGDVVQELPPNTKAVKERKVKKTYIETMTINGAEILDGPVRWPGKYIPIVGVKGKEMNIAGKKYTRGLVRFARDPQRMYNYWRTSETEAVALAPKTPWKVTEKQIAGHETLWNNINITSKPYVLYNVDPKAPTVVPAREQPVEYYAGYQHNAELCSKELMDTQGMYEASIGERSNERSGEAIKQRRAGSDRSNVTYTDNLGRAMRYTGLIIIDLMQYIYDTARSLRILGPDGSEKNVMINSDVDKDGNQLESDKIINMSEIGRYDVAVDIGPSYTTKRLEAVDNAMAFMGNIPPHMQEAIADIIVKNLDWPYADDIAERLKAILPPEIKALIDKETGEFGEDEQNMGAVPGVIPQGAFPAVPEPPTEQPPVDPLMEIKIKQEETKAAQEEAKLTGLALVNKIKEIELEIKVKESAMAGVVDG